MRKVFALLIIFSFFSAMILALSATNTAHAVRVIDTIRVGSEPYAVAYDSGKDEIFVTEQGADLVSVISDTTNTVVATIPVGDHPLGVAYDSGKGEIFVANNYNSAVSVIADSNNTVIATIPVGLNPAWVAYDTGKGEVFVTNSGDNTTSVISDNTNTVTATIPVGDSPSGVAYDSGKSEIFVATNRGNYLNGTVSVISDITNTVTETIPAGTEPYGVAYDSGKDEIFVTNYYAYFNVMFPPTISDTVLVISDFYPLAAPSVSSSPGMVYQGQTSNLTSTALTTGAPPYVYQWFSEAPNASSYSPISNATSSDYSFVTSTSTATGNWSFILQVTDRTLAAVNSTAVTVTVNAALPPKFNETLIIALLTVIVVVALGTVLLVYFRKRKHLSGKVFEGRPD